MSNHSWKLLALLSASVFLSCYSTLAVAGLWGDLAGLVKDPLKLDSMSKRLQTAARHSLAQIDVIREKSNKDAEERLEQLRAVIDFALQGGAAVEAKAYSDMMTLESKIFEDATKFVFEARCTAITLANGTAQNAIVTALANIAAAQPTIKVFGFEIVQYSSKSVPINDPDKFYFETKKIVLADLDRSLTENSAAYTLISAYANLANLAESTRCFYLNKPHEIYFIREENDLALLQESWIEAVVVTPTP